MPKPGFILGSEGKNPGEEVNLRKGKFLVIFAWVALWPYMFGSHALASTWTLEWEWKGPVGDTWRGEAKVALPEEDGPAQGTGTWENHVPSPMVFQKGRLIIRGMVNNHILTFHPQFISQEFYYNGQKLPVPSSDPGLYGPNDTESIRVEDGAVVKVIVSGGPWIWRIKGEKKERWRITVDGWERLVKGNQPKAIPRPKSLGKPSPWTYGTGKSASVKYSDVLYGVLVHWRMVIDVEIEKGLYKKGTGKAFVVSDTPYCNPSGVYKCQSQSIKIANSPFTVRKGVKSGHRLNLTVYYTKYTTSPVISFVSYKCQLDKLAAEMTMAYWKSKKHSFASQVVSKDEFYIPRMISVDLVDNWSKTEGQQGQPNARVYKVKKMR